MKMNIYLVSHKDDFEALYVAAQTLNKAKDYMARDEGERYIDYRGHIVKKNVDCPFGYVSVEDCEKLGLCIGW